MAARQEPTALALRNAGAVYVGAWVAGLLIAPAGPDAAATVAEIHAHYLDHRLAALVQSLLVHGVAGVALAVVVVGLRAPLGRSGRHRGITAAAIVAGLVAAALSLVQVLLLVLLVAGLDPAAALRTAGLRTAIDLVDAAKLLALGVLVAGTATSPLPFRGRAFPALGIVLAPALGLGALSLLLRSPTLTPALYLSLPLLLLWVLAAARIASRPALDRRPRPAPSAIEEVTP